MARRSIKELLVERGLAPSIERAEGLVMAGIVLVSGTPANSPGALISEEEHLELKSKEQPYASRGGLKLQHALENWQIAVTDKICADVGSSTGGFTDVLLKNGAKKVFAIDVGYGELIWQLRQDPRVVVMERTNARTLESLPEQVGFVCIDVSFISVRLILPQVKKWIEPDAVIVVLVKPQFEAPRDKVPEGGVIIDPQVHLEVQEKFKVDATSLGFTVREIIKSPIEGRQGNVEFLAYLSI